MSNGSRVFVGGLSFRVRDRDLERFFERIGRVKNIAIKNGYAFVEFVDYRDADDAVYELNGLELNGKRVSVERARGTPRGSDVWRVSRQSGDISPSPPRRPRRVARVSVERALGTPRGSDVWRVSRQSGDISPSPPGLLRRVARDDRIDRYGPPMRTNYRLIVENLSSRVSWQDLKDFMRQAGEVTYSDAHRRRKNEGLVCFASYSGLKNALDKLDDTELNGRRIKLLEDRSSSRGRSEGRRSLSPSSSRFRSLSRSRSRSHRRVCSRSRSRSRSHSKSKYESRSKSPYKRYSRSPDEKSCSTLR